MLKNILFTLLIFTSSNFAQSSWVNEKLNTVYDDIKIIVDDGISFYTYPFRINTEEAIGVAAFSTLSLITINNDAHFRNQFGTTVNKYQSNIWKFAETYGVVQVGELLGASIYSYGLFADNDEIRKLGRMAIQSITYSGLTAMFIRMIAGRKRPSVTDNPKDFIGFTSDNTYQSFPSGHVTVAFAFSSVFAEYFDTIYSRFIFYGLGSLALTERLINSQHWLTDTLLGATLGILSGIHVVKSEKTRTDKHDSKLSIIPTLNGVTLKFNLN